MGIRLYKAAEENVVSLPPVHTYPYLHTHMTETNFKTTGTRDITEPLHNQHNAAVKSCIAQSHKKTITML